MVKDGDERKDGSSRERSIRNKESGVYFMGEDTWPMGGTFGGKNW